MMILMRLGILISIERNGNTILWNIHLNPWNDTLVIFDARTERFARVCRRLFMETCTRAPIMK